MTIGVDMRMSLDEGHALKWALEYTFALFKKDVIRVPLEIKDDVHSALIKAMQGTCNAIEWAEKDAPAPKPDPRPERWPVKAHRAAADPAAAVTGDVADVPQTQTLEVPFRE